MNKCMGCGVNTKGNLCERCFRIKNYNEYKKVDINYECFLNNLDNIDENDLVVLVVDLLNIPIDFKDINSRISNKIILVLNKFDLMPTYNKDRYINYFRKYGFNSIDTFCISTKNNYNIDNLYTCIKNNASKNVYFIGYTNSGKSSLINKLIYNYSDNNTVITTSFLANTTLDLIEVKLDKFTLIDTPGLINEKGINDLNDTILKKLSKSKKIKPITYQVKGKQYIIVENIIKITVIDSDITIYIPNNITINRYYKDNVFKSIKEICYDIKSTSDIVIPNIGFVKIKRGKVKIELNVDLKLYLREPLI